MDEAKEMLKNQPILKYGIRFLKEIGFIDTYKYCPLGIPFLVPNSVPKSSNDEAAEEEEEKDEKDEKDDDGRNKTLVIGLHMPTFVFALSYVVKHHWLLNRKEKKMDFKVTRPSFRSTWKKLAMNMSDVPSSFVDRCAECFPYKIKTATPSSRSRSGSSLVGDLLFIPANTLHTLMEVYESEYTGSVTRVGDDDYVFNLNTSSRKPPKPNKKLGIIDDSKELVGYTKAKYAMGMIPFYEIPCSKEYFECPLMGWEEYFKSSLYQITYRPKGDAAAQQHQQGDPPSGGCKLWTFALVSETRG